MARKIAHQTFFGGNGRESHLSFLAETVNNIFGETARG